MKLITCASLLLALSSASAWAQSTLIYAGKILPAANADVLERQTLEVVDGRVQGIHEGYVSAQTLGLADAHIIDLKEQFVMPGLIDLHVHISFERDPQADPERWLKEVEADQALRATQFLGNTLNAGFTTVRDLGSYNEVIFPLQRAVESGVIQGPRIIAAGEAVTPTGGHGDLHGYRQEVLDAFAPRMGVCNGADDCTRAVREIVKAGAQVIKITATGGVLSNTQAGLNQQLTDEEMKAIVDTAHNLGRPVTAHAHSAQGVAAALRSGVDSIEHGSYANDETVALFKSTGAYLVPTLLAGISVSEEVKHNDKVPQAIVDKITQVAPVVKASFQRALDEGVNIAFGTDSGVSRHGDNAREFALLVEYGMSPREALATSLEQAPKLLNMGKEVGKLQNGYYADVIAVAQSPLKDISQLSAVTFVMKEGKVIKHHEQD
ncbi:metal-dependent hydrolase family protein [Pseudoalteromonas ruthenica]|uniref:metal-dependent hydrolase family protein n=1 Tax=Pseudoalteromonas ruthenica TaxID=151081 RepID=UPI00110BEC2D|nr:amidohydrolase family protein [Pseudoalteromonas ruthenica]TMO47900.1 Xaa-Pro dipeptidase [Pseudoalteromonas ruthenica]TMO52801.1 Xaa-Pro dipeptidase [Pseudoalteromonas ruthenica]TMO89698.1 Xaa-Pro dipeptidase [Pseudoalteromonas ruthenica]TMP24535.1 Xaa-Pro dipeptidase [Pseudoalteromonas ruthenica]